MLTCASPGYLAEHGQPRTLDELMRHKAVNTFSGPDRKLMDWHFQVDGEDRIVRLKSGILVNETEAFVASGLADFGIMQGLQLTLQPFIDSGELIAVLPELPAQPKSISVLYPHRHYLAPKVRVFIDWLTERVRQKGLG